MTGIQSDTSALQLVAVELCELSEDFLLVLHSDASPGIYHLHPQQTHGIHPDLTQPKQITNCAVLSIHQIIFTFDKIMFEFPSPRSMQLNFICIVPPEGVNLT